MATSGPINGHIGEVQQCLRKVKWIQFQRDSTLPLTIPWLSSTATPVKPSPKFPLVKGSTVGVLCLGV